jgi:predicted alpha-1,2-mannosidase
MNLLYFLLIFSSKKLVMRLFGLLLTAILFSGVSPAQTSSFDPLSYVDPFIGTGGHGHTFPGATVPFGMVQLSPDTRLTGWDGCSGYHYSDSLVYGFSHTHLSGTGVSDYGDILLMPATGPVQVHNGADGQPGYRSLFLKNKEEAGPGFYRTYLEDHQVDVKLTASERVGFHEYRFDSRENPHIVIDLEHRDAVLGAYIRQVSPTEIEGYRYSTAWARDQRVYFVARFSKPVRQFQVYDQDVVKEGTELQGKDVKAVCSFDLIPREKVSVKVAISAVSIDGARANLEAAIPGFEFESYHQSARLKWRQALSKIEVEDDDTDLLTSFYTALYHCMIAPNLFIDADGGYLGTDLKPHRLEGEGNHYTIFSLWDTYRATHPLYTIIEQQRTVDFIRTFLRQYEEGGQLPVWELAANYTGCMIGYHSVPVIVDAYRKGIGGYDANLALEAMKHSAEQDHLGLASYKKYGFILSNEEGEAVSKTLEYAYDDWCIAQMAQMMDRQEDYQHYIRRAQAYKNMYDPQTGFMRPRSQHQWVSPFDPREVNFHYTEANAWQYHFYVPHDMNWMIETHGGKEGLGQKLDALFTTTSETTGREQPDITGLIGQYAHGNEPSHHIAYLYNYVNQPWKTQNYLSKIVYDFYTPKPDGLIGNEDCGQMSAWLVFTSMGFYPVLPGSDEYVIGRPFFDRVTIHLENGNTFVIDAKGLKKDRPYVKSVQLNGNRS